MADQNQNPAGTGAGGQPVGQQSGGQQAPLKVNIPDAVKGGSYSNAVSVNVNTNEVVVDFGYLLPNTTDPEIEVVSRVNMNHKTAESFLNVLRGAMDDFKTKSSAQGAAPTPAPVGAPVPAPVPAPIHAAPLPPAPPVHGAPLPPAPPAGPTPPPPPLPEHS